MSITPVLRVGALGLLVSVFLMVGASLAIAKPLCHKPVCAATKGKAMTLAAQACGWSKDFRRADCTCLNSGGDCGRTPEGEAKTYQRCTCGVGKSRESTSDTRTISRCFDGVLRTHESEGKLAAQVAALKCVGLPVKPERLKVLLGPKPGAVVLVVSPSFAEREVLKSTLNKQHVLDVIPDVVRIEVDPHVRRLKVRSNGVGFSLTDLLK